jgi:hypothetical protein
MEAQHFVKERPLVDAHSEDSSVLLFQVFGEFAKVSWE